MTILFFWRCEATTLSAGVDFSVGDTTAAAVGPASIDAAAARYGSNGILAASVGAGARLQFAATDLGNPAEGAVAFAFRYVSAIAGAGQPLIVFRDSASDEAVRVNSNGDGNLQLEVEAAATPQSVLLTRGLVVADTWYRLIIRWDQPGSRRRIELYDDSLKLIDMTEDLTAFTAAAASAFTLSNGFRIGILDSVTRDQYQDQIFTSDLYEEPLQNNFALGDIDNYDSTPADLPQLFSGPPGFIATIERRVA